jgi:rhodanese-related sulfurtransferase
MTASSQPPFPPDTDGGTVSLEDLHAALEAGACALVDVREPHEFAVGHIPGATNLPLSSFDPAELPAGKSIVLVCQAGGRSLRALRDAVEAGVTDIRHYPGGTTAWRTQGGDLEV